MNDLFSKEQLHELYVNQGISTSTLSVLYGAAESTIHKVLRSYGFIKRLYVPKHIRPPRKWKAGFLPLYRDYRTGASERGYSFDLTEQQFYTLIKNDCYYCGAAPQRGSQYKLLRNGIDRVDNTQGYTLENSRPCCFACNWMKHKMSEQQCIDHVLQIANHQTKSK
jgi:hypothetical protein